MKLFLSATEASADIHGAELVRAIREILPANSPLEIFGVGGPHLRAAGLKAVVQAEELSVMGISEVFSKIPRIARALRQLTRVARSQRPDLAVVLDSPDFHFRLAKRFRKLGVPLVYYIPPKIWVWRKGRIRFLKKYFAKVLSILPFEEDYYRHEKIPFRYVGNPLIEELPQGLTRLDARLQLGLQPHDTVLLMMPGSRSSEIRLHFPLMIEAAQRVATELRARGRLGASQLLQVLVPLPSSAAQKILQTAYDRWRAQAPSLFEGLEIKSSHGNAHQGMVAADIGLIKSGTSTLEAALLNCCQVIVYRPKPLTAWLYQNVVRFPGPVGLVNWVAGWKLGQSWAVPELLCEKATPEAMAQEVLSLLFDPSRQAKMETVYEQVRARMGFCPSEGGAQRPSQIAAQEILATLRERGFTC